MHIRSNFRANYKNVSV